MNYDTAPFHDLGTEGFQRSDELKRTIWNQRL